MAYWRNFDAMSTSPVYPVSTIAKLFNLTERRVQQLAKDGIIPKAERGKYDLVGCVRGYIKYLQDLAFGREVASFDTHKESARLKKAQADHKQFQVEIIKGEWIPREEVQDLFNEVAVIYGSSLDAIGGRQANELAAITNPAEIRQILFAESRQIRESTAEKLIRYAESIGDRGGEVSPSSTTQDSG